MAENTENFVLDTKAFDAFITESPNLVQRYDTLNTTYDDIVKILLNDWVGEGAEAFRIDAKKVKANITGIYDILKIMCDTLTDCRQIFEECDKSLGDYNRNPSSGE